MKTLTVLTLLTLALTTNLALAEDNPAYKGFYLVGNTRVDLKKAESAIMAAIKGQEVYKCQTVEAKLNKTGTSIGMKNVKRTK